MKKFTFIFLSLLVVFSASQAMAVSRSILVEWGYTPPSAPAVTGFCLYQESVKTKCVTNASATSMDANVILIKPDTSFTLTATFADNTESPQSSPFIFHDNGTVPTGTTAPVIKSITLIQL